MPEMMALNPARAAEGTGWEQDLPLTESGFRLSPLAFCKAVHNMEEGKG